MSTQIAPLASQRLKKNKYSVLVRTGNPVMDKIVYEIAVMEFGRLLDINESENQIDQNGRLEFTFASTSQSAFIGSSSTVGSAKAAATGWYDGNGYWRGTGYASGTSTTIASGTAFTWQNSTMLMSVRDSNGTRLWTADYNYKGGWEMSGWSVNTADEAARLCIKRLEMRMESDLCKSNK
jgi:hypothetical protein